MDDFLSAAGENLVKGDLIWAFLDVMCEQSKYKAKTYSTRLFNNITQGRLNAEYNAALNTKDTLNNDVLLFPIFHNTGHWSIVVVYPKIKIILHFDSKHQLSQHVFDGILFFLYKYHLSQKFEFKHLELTLIATKQITAVIPID